MKDGARDAAFALAVLLASTSAIARADRIELRNGDVVEGRITAVESGAIAIRRAVGGGGGAGASGAGGASAGGVAADGPGAGLEATDRLSWDRVARVELDRQAAPDPELTRFLELGERLWRARGRLSRGDSALAEQALGPEWRFARIDGPTGLVAALVELQVALARRDLPRAWRAWLEAARLERRGVREPSLETWLDPQPSGSMARRIVFDPATGLCPSLPPFAGSDEEKIAILAVLDGFDAGDDRELDALRRALAAIVEPARDGPAASASKEKEETESRRTFEFLRLLRDARSSELAERAKAREAIGQQRRRLAEWTEAWSRFAVGSGLLLDATPESTLAAQLELMHLPARFAESQPWLTDRATVLAAEASRTAGRADEARRIGGKNEGTGSEAGPAAAPPPAAPSSSTSPGP